MWIGSIAWSELSCSSASKAALGVPGWAWETSRTGTEDSSLTGIDGGRRNEEYELELVQSCCHDGARRRRRLPRYERCGSQLSFFFSFFSFFCFGDGKYVTEYAESHDDARVLRLVFEAGLQLLQMHGTAYGISIQV